MSDGPRQWRLVSFLKAGGAEGLRVFRGLCVPSKGLGGRVQSRLRPQGLWLADPHDQPTPKAVRLSSADTRA